jgi:tellurite resistance protein TerC
MSMHVWVITLALLGVVLAFDLAIALFNRNKETSLKAAIGWTLFYVALAIAFGYSLGIWSTHQARSEFFAGWITEYSLSFDNLFVFILILARLKVAKEKEELVLLIGIVISLLLRGVFIAGGSAIVNRWSWIFFIFGGFLIYTAIQLFRESSEEEWEEGKFIAFIRNKGASTFVVALTAISLTNVLFAFDSIPAIFGLTKSPYIIVTANLFALMGLRQLYFLIGGLMEKLIYLTEGLSIILAFIGLKLVFEACESQGWHKILGAEIPHVPLTFSLGFIIVALSLTAALSLLKSRKSHHSLES